MNMPEHKPEKTPDQPFQKFQEAVGKARAAATNQSFGWTDASVPVDEGGPVPEPKTKTEKVSDATFVVFAFCLITVLLMLTVKLGLVLFT